jgi:hypothetical protein
LLTAVLSGELGGGASLFRLLFRVVLQLMLSTKKAQSKLNTATLKFIDDPLHEVPGETFVGKVDEPVYMKFIRFMVSRKGSKIWLSLVIFWINV